MIGSFGQLWKMFIRPVRQDYTRGDLGTQFRNHYKISETDSSSKFPCIIYCHCNSGSRLEALRLLPHIVQEGIGLVCFDFAGSGLSEGEYVTLGLNENHDLECVVNYLQESEKVSNIALWGRSMGAATNILYMGRKPSQKQIKCIVFDSGFSNMSQLTIDIAKQKTGLPNMIIEPALYLVNDQVKEKIGLDIQSIDLAKTIHNVYIPIHFICSKEDTFVKCDHSERLYERYNGLKWIDHIPGGHTSNRSNEVIDKLVDWAAYFLFEKKKPTYYQYIPKIKKSSELTGQPACKENEMGEYVSQRKGSLQTEATNKQSASEALKEHLKFLNNRLAQPMQISSVSNLNQVRVLGSASSKISSKDLNSISSARLSGGLELPNRESREEIKGSPQKPEQPIKASFSLNRITSSFGDQNKNRNSFGSQAYSFAEVSFQKQKLKESTPLEQMSSDSHGDLKNKEKKQGKSVNPSIEIDEFKQGQSQGSEYYSSQTRAGTEETYSKNDGFDSNNNSCNFPSSKSHSNANAHTYSFLSTNNDEGNTIDKIISNIPHYSHSTKAIQQQDLSQLTPRDLRRRQESRSVVDTPFVQGILSKQQNDNYKFRASFQENLLPLKEKSNNNSLERSIKERIPTAQGTPQFKHLNKPSFFCANENTTPSNGTLRADDKNEFSYLSNQLPNNNNNRYTKSFMILNSSKNKEKVTNLLGPVRSSIQSTQISKKQEEGLLEYCIPNHNEKSNCNTKQFNNNNNSSKSNLLQERTDDSLNSHSIVIKQVQLQATEKIVLSKKEMNMQHTLQNVLQPYNIPDKSIQSGGSTTSFRQGRAQTYNVSSQLTDIQYQQKSQRNGNKDKGSLLNGNENENVTTPLNQIVESKEEFIQEQQQSMTIDSQLQPSTCRLRSYFSTLSSSTTPQNSKSISYGKELQQKEQMRVKGQNMNGEINVSQHYSKSSYQTSTPNLQMNTNQEQLPIALATQGASIYKQQQQKQHQSQSIVKTSIPLNISNTQQVQKKQQFLGESAFSPFIPQPQQPSEYFEMNNHKSKLNEQQKPAQLEISKMDQIEKSRYAPDVEISTSSPLNKVNNPKLGYQSPTPAINKFSNLTLQSQAYSLTPKSKAIDFKFFNQTTRNSQQQNISWNKDPIQKEMVAGRQGFENSHLNSITPNNNNNNKLDSTQVTSSTPLNKELFGAYKHNRNFDNSNNYEGSLTNIIGNKREQNTITPTSISYRITDWKNE